MAMIIITHDLGVIAEIAEDIVVMYLGKSWNEEVPWSVFHNPRHPYTQALLESIPRIDADRQRKLATIEGVVPDVQYSAGLSILPALLSRAIPGTCNVVEPASAKSTGHAVACHLYAGGNANG